ncbi:MAG: CHASE2 domain-containing protein [Desulfobacterales bacterium]|nr:CHASE2 domain-containing protein [Desulfobacterales bacterium]
MKLNHHFLNALAFAKHAVASTTKLLFEKVSGYRGYFLRAVLIGLAISVIVTALARIGYFKPYQNPLTNLLHFITQKKAHQVVLLFITEEEYKRGFQGISPLSRARLAELVNVMVKLKAKVIALDIDISDSSSEDRKLSDAIGRASAAGIPTVVIGNLMPIEDKPHSNEDSLFDLRPYKDERLHTTEDGFMLFEDMSPGSQWMDKVIYGGTLFRLDTDRVFRMGEGFYMIKNKGPKYKPSYLPVPSFPVAVAAAYQGVSQEALMEALLNVHDSKITLSSTKDDHRDDIYIHLARGNRVIPNFIGNYEHFDREVNLKGLLEEYRSNPVAMETIVKEKIVIVGGTYDKKDFYMTPVGRMAGMEILANITQSILNGTLITPASFWKAFVIQVILGIAVALIFILFSRFWATLLCLLALVPGVAIASLWSFSSSHYWFDFVPTIGGVMLYGQIIEAGQVLKKMKHKLQARLEKKRRLKR